MPSNPIDTNESGVSALHYPRTGKRGVPQQFPRRLYEMLQSETKLIEASADHPKIIFWSESGKAFRIADVAEFSTTILPKYFRTKKFSSFQRNLNLYGFTKLRRGQDVDSYHHPSFARDQSESLSKLRKLSSTSSSRRRAREVPVVSKPVKMTLTRSVSPSPTMMIASAPFHAPIASMLVSHQPPTYASPKHTSVWAPIHQVAPVSPEGHSCKGGLDLLTLAMEQVQQH